MTNFQIADHKLYACTPDNPNSPYLDRMDDQIMDVSFRTARPEDVALAVPLIYSSGPVAFDYVFSVPRKGSGADFIEYCFPKAGGEIDYQKHSVAIVDHKIVGIGAGFGGHAVMGNTLSITGDMLRFYGPIRVFGVLKRGLLFQKMVKPPIKSEFAIIHIGVAPSMRGKGIGRLIMEHLIERARSEGYPTAVLDVADKNDTARLLYERLGFKIKHHYPCALKRKDQPDTVPGHYRMELPLNLK